MEPVETKGSENSGLGRHGREQRSGCCGFLVPTAVEKQEEEPLLPSEALLPSAALVPRKATQLGVHEPNQTRGEAASPGESPAQASGNDAALGSIDTEGNLDYTFLVGAYRMPEDLARFWALERPEVERFLSRGIEPGKLDPQLGPDFVLPGGQA